MFLCISHLLSVFVSILDGIRWLIQIVESCWILHTILVNETMVSELHFRSEWSWKADGWWLCTLRATNILTLRKWIPLDTIIFMFFFVVYTWEVPLFAGKVRFIPTTWYNIHRRSSRLIAQALFFYKHIVSLVVSKLGNWPAFEFQWISVSLPSRRLSNASIGEYSCKGDLCKSYFLRFKVWSYFVTTFRCNSGMQCHQDVPKHRALGSGWLHLQIFWFSALSSQGFKLRIALRNVVAS